MKLKLRTFSILSTLGQLALKSLLSTALMFMIGGGNVLGQVSLTNGNPSVTIDFSNTTQTSVGSNPATAFNGSGFQANPTAAGRLNSNAWALTGWSDGALAFGGTRNTSNTDYTRGSTSVAVSTGGIFAYTGTPQTPSNPCLMIQPGGSDWAPGTLTLRVQNNGSTNITELAISYNLYIRNDQARSSSFNFSHSSDDINYTNVSALDYTSPAAVDANGWVLVGTSPSRSTTITGLNIAPSGYYYIRWSGADVGGSGSRDEFGLDDIIIGATFGLASSAPLLTTPTSSSITDISATLGATITADGGSAITARGTAFNTTSPVAATDNALAEGGTATGAFSHSRTGLSPQTRYFYVGYATNANGTGLSSEGQFRTLSSPPTSQASAVNASTASSTQIDLSITAATFPSSGATQAGYVIIYATGTPSLSSTNGQAPAAGVGTIFTTSASNLPSTPATSINVTGLTSGTTYNFLVVPYTWDGTNTSTYNYLTASAPTASATTASGAPTLSTPTVSAITNSSATLGATVVTDGGSALTERGTAFKTSSPVLATDNALAEGGTAVSAFTQSRTGLSAETQYFFVGYATNNTTTAISSEGSFRTLSNPPTAQASLSAAAASTSQINLTITAASFPASGATQAGYVVIYATGTPTFTATNGQAPTAGVGTIFATSASTLPSTPATTVNVTGLTQSTAYNFLLVPYTWDGVNASTYHYLTALAPTASATTQGVVTIANWDFTTASPSTTIANTTVSALSQGNNNGTTALINGTSASSGYSGASGGNNASAAARTGALNTSANGSAYFEFTIAPIGAYDVVINNLSFGSRETGTGPANYALRSSLDNYASDIFTGSLSASSTWILRANGSALNISITAGQSRTFRIYGYNGVGSPGANTSNWRIDDLKIEGNVTANTSPIVNVSSSSLTNFTQVSSTPSAEQSYTVSGDNLTGDVTITPPTGFEISTTTGGSFSATNPITLSVSGGDIVGEPVTIYVRQNAATLGAISGNIEHSSAGANNPNVAVSGTRTGTYYSKSTGNLDELGTWGLNTDGSGASPANFTTNGIIYEIRNRATATIGANWTVSGSSSKIVVESGDFTIPAGFAVSGTIDVNGGAELTIENTTQPTLGSIASGSTIQYNNIALTIPQITYANLTLSGTGTKTFAANTTTVSGNLLIDNTTINAPGSSPFATISLGGNLTYQGTVTNPADANSITLETNGTAAGTQTITANGNTVRFFRIQTTTANTLLMSTTGGSSNILVGNSASGGITLINGSVLNLNGNDLTFLTGGGANLSLGTSGSISGGATTNLTFARGGSSTLGTLRMTSGANMVRSLTLNHSGSSNTTLTLGNAIEVTDEVTLTAGSLVSNGNLTLKSTSAASTARINGGTNASITGNVNFERFLPWAGAGNNGFRFATHSLRTAPVINTISGLPVATNTLILFNETNNSYEGISNRAGTWPLAAGYGVWTNAANTLTYTGEPQLNSVGPISLPRANAGWHYLGNPFPSVLDWEAVTRTQVDNAIYIWEKDNTGEGNGVWGSYVNGTTANNGSQYVAPGQGFAVRSQVGSPEITFPAAARSTAANPAYYRLSNQADILRVRVTKASNQFTLETVIRFRDLASSNFDPSYDALFVSDFSNNSPDLYTTDGQGNKYSINSLAPLGTQPVLVPLQLETFGAGNYSFTFNSSAMISGASIQLEDTKTGSFTPIANGDVINFIAGANDATGRFRLHFNGLATSVAANSLDQVQVYTFEGKLYIRGMEQAEQLRIVDMTGRVVYQHAAVQLSAEGLQPQLAAGTYLVQLVGKQGVKTAKVQF